MGWDTEKEWVTASGLPAVVKRCSFDIPGHPEEWRCGYVGVPKGNLLYGITYSEQVEELPDLPDETPIGDRGTIPFYCGGGKKSLDIYYDVHGSLTFSDWMSDDHTYWWMGFDCHHIDDTMENCNLEYVTAQCEKLALQIKESTNGKVTNLL